MEENHKDLTKKSLIARRNPARSNLELALDRIGDVHIGFLRF